MTQDTFHSRPYLKGHLYETGTWSWSLPFFTSYIWLSVPRWRCLRELAVVIILFDHIANQSANRLGFCCPAQIHILVILLSQVIFVSSSLAYIIIPKNKRKTKNTWDKKLTTTYISNKLRVKKLDTRTVKEFNTLVIIFIPVFTLYYTEEQFVLPTEYSNIGLDQLAFHNYFVIPLRIKFEWLLWVLVTLNYKLQ